MHRLTRRLTTVLALAALAGLMALPAAAQTHRLAGPWYTQSELKALKAYAAGSFAEKQHMLGATHAAAAWHSLTARERHALDVYANASFAEKQRILAGQTAYTPSHDGIQWEPAAGGALLVIAVALIGGALLVRRRQASHA